MFIGQYQFELVLSIICFLLGSYTLLTTQVNTRKLNRAVPVLVGMLAWLLLGILALSAIYQIEIVGRTNAPLGVLEYTLYRLSMAIIWYDYLRQINRRYKVCQLGYYQNDKNTD